jgi:hypothetical protein
MRILGERHSERGIMRTAVSIFGLSIIVGSASIVMAETATDIATRDLLEALEERQMPDISLWVLDRVATDENASPELKKEAAFRRAAALVAVSRNEADSTKRARFLDEAQQSLDAFVASGEISDRQAIAAFTQRGNLLIERGRAKADQANRPGVDADSLRAEALAFFDGAIKSLRGTVKPGEEITALTNAEDAVLKVLREVTAQVKALEGPGKAEQPKGRPTKPVRMTALQQRQLAALKEDQEALQGKLIQTRLAAAAAVFEKAKAYPETSKERAETITESAQMFKQLADKYPTMGGGLFARYYEGRNYAALGKWDQAVRTLVPLVALEQRVPLAIMLRSRALNTTLECLLAEKKLDQFDEAARKFALEDVKRLPGAQLDADWLGLKYRAALILDARAESLDAKDAKTRADRTRLEADAKKLAIEVATANREFAAEARELSAKLGKVVAEGDKTFAGMMAEARVALAAMQEHQAGLKAAGADANAAALARAAAVTARDEAMAKLEEALRLAGIAEPLAADPAVDDALQDAPIDDINQARYLLTYLLYDGQRFEESARLGRLLVDRYPNAKGARQAAKIAMAAWQQAGLQADGEARSQAQKNAADLAAAVMRVWPNEAESADAAVIALGAARDPAAMVAIIGQVPATAPRRAEVLFRAGTALWREVQEARRSDEAVRPDEGSIEAWKTASRQALDDGLASLAEAADLPTGSLATLSVAAAVSRVQIAMDDDDTAKALAVLEQPVFGPWTLWAGKQPVVQQGSLAEATLTLALRLFIQTEEFEKAQQAMSGLEQVAGQGEEAAARLNAMYFAMGRDLQAQLEHFAVGAAAGDQQARAKGEKVLGGFETFLDRVAARDQKTSSQFWVANTFLALGSGQGLGAIVPKSKSDRYLQRAADVFGKLLGNTVDPDVARFEPGIRLRMANIYQELRQWDEAQQQIDWILADPKRQNSLDSQIQAAELLQARAAAAAQAGDSDTADSLLREAAGGRRGEPVTIWGWGNIANRLARQGLAGNDTRAQQARNSYFNARLQVVECLLARARLPGKETAKKDRLAMAETAITMTRKLYPDLGGPSMEKRFEQLLKQIQRELGEANPQGFAALDQPKPAAGGGQ